MSVENDSGQEPTSDDDGGPPWGRLFALAFGVVILGGMTIVIGTKARQAYWDRKVAEMCDRDGGVKVFHTVSLTKDEYNNILNSRQQVDLPHIRHASEHQPFAYSFDTEHILTGSLSVMKHVTRVIQTKDQLVLAEKVVFLRVGGDLPTIIGHDSCFICPSFRDNFFEQPFKQN